MAVPKGNSVKIKTFFDWNVSNTIGYKDDGVRVNFVWCKVCAGNKEALKTHPNLRGAIKTGSINAFTNGTNVVTKYQVRVYN